MADMIEQVKPGELPFALYSLETDPAGEYVGEFLMWNGFPVLRTQPVVSSRQKIFFDLDVSSYMSPKERIERAITSVLPSNGRVLAVFGRGTSHYLTYGLCRRADNLSSQYGYIHIDNHSDDLAWYDYGPGSSRHMLGDDERITGGNFVRKIVSETNVTCPNVLFVGSNGHLQGAHSINGAALYGDTLSSLEKMLDVLPNDVYVSIDLDVMASQEIRTDFCQGSMRLDKLLAILGMIRAKKRIISADVCGLDLKYKLALPNGIRLYAEICSSFGVLIQKLGGGHESA